MSPSPTASDRTRQLRRVALSGLLGTAVEFYDFLVYGTVAALVFGELFFPGADPAVGTIAAFGTFAAGYVARPIGGIVFGHFGDRLGRKNMLLLTMGLMGGASFLIGLLPTYDTIGVWAPVLLITLRVLQGIAIGGEWGGATLMVVEHAGEKRRGLWSSFTQMGAPLGSLISAAVVAMVSTLPKDQFAAWGWRVPFLLSVLLLGVGLFVRLKVVESPLFAEVRKDRAQSRLPILDVLKRPRPVLLACCVGIGAFTAQSLLTSYLIAYATGIGYPRPQVLTALTVSAAVALVVLPCASALSDRIGRRPVVLTGAILSAATAFPVLALVDSRSSGALILAVVIGHGISQSLMYGPLGALFSEMFGTRVRYTGASLGYQGATLVGAGFSPMIAGSLVASSGNGTPVALLLCGGSLITALTVWFVRETSRTSLGDAPASELPGTPRTEEITA
ncbi:MHS family shikimate/dehydroshikimate transporter-like MFS transporter [Streptomyces sp. SAI-135]|uniref:MFS transporter n=1 Tax=unclassified Streptomyces TaxID=2593676 RepID=UPI002474EEF7|nr:MULTISPECIES: MFS transporter [unclassified Streptomyces]MDH6517315.1 MHS family shikimate/dehydroshikimate transporter-like MFS transporter [Streptomyces sp. SAI-090]MDH6586457.1 MHS family shikimate/dehydroshikimate transporter-like MFS transporter [Streptomyces sp. SAI-133]MDH6618596.1 MHS family shikimate/dehydroshikimate transporter-like MFS transporter [Streptomyces sp. SAI-135]